MSKKIRILNPDWSFERPAYLDQVMDRDELLEALETASQLPVPFECEIDLGGFSVSARIGIESVLVDMGIQQDVFTEDLGTMYQSMSEAIYE